MIMSEVTNVGEGSEIRRPEVSREGAATGLFKHEGEQNVGTGERIATALVGLGLVRLSLKRQSLLGKVVLASFGGMMIHRSATGYCPAYKAMNISTAQQHPARAEDYFERGIHVESSYLVNADPAKLYAFWHDFSNLPKVMSHLKKVECLTNVRSRWTANAPMGRTVSWEAEIIHDVPNELIAWKSVGNSEVENAGSVHFTAGRNGGQTEVRVVLDYIPPAGRVGKMVAQLFGEAPEQTIKEDLRKFKSLMETGEVATTNGQPHGSVG
jgi:uncharacterized membrane protein